MKKERRDVTHPVLPRYHCTLGPVRPGHRELRDPDRRLICSLSRALVGVGCDTARPG